MWSIFIRINIGIWSDGWTSPNWSILVPGAAMRASSRMCVTANWQQRELYGDLGNAFFSFLDVTELCVNPLHVDEVVEPDVIWPRFCSLYNLSKKVEDACFRHIYILYYASSRVGYDIQRGFSWCFSVKFYLTYLLFHGWFV